MAFPIYAEESLQDVEVVGRELFRHFIQDELTDQGLQKDAIDLKNPPPDVFEDADTEADADSALPEVALPELVRTPEGFNTQTLISKIQKIKELADRFRASDERKLVQEQASEIDLDSVTQSSFRHFLFKFLENGIDKYRIVALFYFCSDVLIRCVLNKLHRLASKLFFWALGFLVRHVCKWVYDQGGWDRVFSKFYDFGKKLVFHDLGRNWYFIAAIAIVVIIFMRRNA